MYNRFAQVYDELMADIPYENYLAWVVHEVGNLKGKQLLDLGCGTGTLSIPFAHMGAHVTAVDLSQEMLDQASEKAQQEQAELNFDCVSMTDFATDEPVDVAIIAIDSLNYLQHAEEVQQTFERIFSVLQNEGHLFFDVHSLAKIEAYLQGPFIYEDEEVAYMWSTEAGEEGHSVYHDITFFLKNEDERYERFEEHHYQRTFPLEKYIQWLKQAGFTTVTVEDSIFGEDHFGLRHFIHAKK
ncbi:methyltransferase domain-containing protein [Chryseomicrobium sp. FSL W7-1435]|uniref:class I SAM-dependent DNA methyltransferase n=1 Tax=Chryseomicrobium sp. FSL W7-1435 TaxID=2921704 RepID=UPI00315A4577